jgi:hypothetical protein
MDLLISLPTEDGLDLSKSSQHIAIRERVGSEATA